jgi:hypothetical protein
MFVCIDLRPPHHQNCSGDRRITPCGPRLDLDIGVNDDVIYDPERKSVWQGILLARDLTVGTDLGDFFKNRGSSADVGRIRQRPGILERQPFRVVSAVRLEQ